MIEIAGNKTDQYWYELEEKLKADFNNSDLWSEALDLFELRINERYINPAEVIQNNMQVTGEGFSIITLLCSLIEALETFHNGKCYKHDTPRKNTEYGNGNSKTLFISFLTTKEPFNNYFNKKLAEDFYKNVRCALLHEAMTRNGWAIRIDSKSLIEIENDKKIINRFYFLENLKIYIKKYREIVLKDKNLKNAFIRKMECICKNA